jgi:hypothetical protein
MKVISINIKEEKRMEIINQKLEKINAHLAKVKKERKLNEKRKSNAVNKSVEVW